MDEYSNVFAKQTGGENFMRVLILSWRGPGHPHVGGAEIVTFEHAKAWVRAGHEVTLLTSFYNGAESEELLNGVHIIRMGGAELGVKFFACMWYLFGSHKKFDIVVDEFHGIPFFTPLYIRVKKLGFIHEVAKEVWFLNYNTLKASIGYYLEPWIFKLFYKNIPFMTVSRSTKKDLVDWGVTPNNITVINNGVNIVHPKSGVKKEKKKTIIFLGALSKDKGIEDALKVFSYIHQQDDNIQFWVVGKGVSSYLKVLEKQIKELGINKVVKFWGYVSDEKKFELLKRAYILINPSIREGWGLVVIEAASMGTPTVGYNVPGLKDSILHNKTGLLSTPNPHESVDIILSLLANEKLYDHLRRNCIVWSKNFTWENATLLSLKIIEKVANP